MSRLIITRPKLTVWAEKIGASGLPQAEHDYRLVMALKGLLAHPELSRELAFKGGTALNKLYYGESNRLSVDLDFNAVGSPGLVMKRGAPLRKLVEGVLREQDPEYQLSYKYSEGPTIDFDARAAVGSFLERFAFLGEPDEADLRFLETGKALVGRTVSEKKRAKALAGAHPIRELMDGLAITGEAAAVTIKDLARVLRKEAGR